MNDGYRFELTNPHDPEELERISALLRTVFPRAKHLTARYLAWQYRDNPDGEGVGCNAWAGGELVGHMAACAMVGRLEGSAQKGQFIVNGAVAVAHRRKRLQSRISTAIFEESVRRGFVFCFSTGNRLSTVALLTRFKMLRPLEARLGFGLPVRRADPPAPSFERVWSPEAMRWRLANPERSYGLERRDGSLAVLADSGMPGISAMLYDGADPGGAGEGVAVPGPLRLWLGLDPAVRWGSSPFVPIPRWLRPSPLNLVFRDLTGGGYLPDPDRLVFRGLDSDPY